MAHIDYNNKTEAFQNSETNGISKINSSILHLKSSIETISQRLSDFIESNANLHQNTNALCRTLSLNFKADPQKCKIISKISEKHQQKNSLSWKSLEPLCKTLKKLKKLSADLRYSESSASLLAEKQRKREQFDQKAISLKEGNWRSVGIALLKMKFSEEERVTLADEAAETAIHLELEIRESAAAVRGEVAKMESRLSKLTELLLGQFGELNGCGAEENGAREKANPNQNGLPTNTPKTPTPPKKQIPPESIPKTPESFSAFSSIFSPPQSSPNPTAKPADSAVEKLDRWEFKNGARKNIRTLLSTLHLVLWEEARGAWPKLDLAALMSRESVRRHYRRALLLVHPDRCARQKAYSADAVARIFHAIKAAWGSFEAGAV